MPISEISISNLFKVLMIAGIIVTWLSGCKDNSNNSETEDKYVQVTNTQSYGNVLADEEGKVLYFFALDVKGESMCEEQCIDQWPAFYTEQFVPGDGLILEEFDMIARADGSSQTTYKGWPLYYFANDNQPGDINGDGVNGLWFVAKPDYSLMIANEQLVGEDGKNYTSNYEEGDGNTTLFTDAKGRAIYQFSFDEANTNNFTADDFSNNDVWPIFHVDIDELQLPAGVNPEDFGEIFIHGVEQQLTYKGWPLYYFGQDTERGDTKGISFPNPGIWPIVNTDTPQAQ